MADPPPTDEGWFVLHDFRRIDWPAWEDTPKAQQEAATEAAVEFLETTGEGQEGETAVFTITGQEADLLTIHLRPTLDAIERAERQFNRTPFGRFAAQSRSFVSVTEVGGYTSQDYFDEDAEADPGLARYMESKLYPSIPEDTYVSFYPMGKRRDPEYNWYDTPMEDRAEMMAEHGETGKGYAGTITQYITSGFGLDDWEWGVTLFSTEATALKRIVYEMRFDEATAKYGEFGPFFVGHRFPAADLGAYMDGEPVPSEREEAEAETETDSVRETLAEEGVYAGQPRGEDVYAVALYSEASVDTLTERIDGLRSNFEHYDTHVSTAVYHSRDDGPNAVVSIWDTQSAMETASGFLADLPKTVGLPGDVPDGWGTMGMFYTVKAGHREEFVETFDGVVEALEEVTGHRETDLLVNTDEENDMFIASQWEARNDAMGFFESEDFRETVSAGREMLADRPRHVFLE
ncbi:heme-binding protein [Halodesulfurarchaeum sp.]|uniref:heme-binding protein n=1 Tax=Halodesulfurarchaeum sp. TaxID=1980530 RepID=UPI001BC41D96|nr:heme-binding protein [Halodesulfurarchaeum sp.]